MSGQVDTVSSKQAVVKKCEDTIVFGLTMIAKCLRGAAEILGDSTATGMHFYHDIHTYIHTYIYHTYIYIRRGGKQAAIYRSSGSHHRFAENFI